MIGSDLLDYWIITGLLDSILVTTVQKNIKPVHYSSTEKRFFTCVFEAEIMVFEYLFIK